MKKKECNFEDGFIKGEVVRKKLNGKGTFYYFNGEILEGNFKDDELCGFGQSISLDNKCRFQGEYYEGKKNGRGIFYYDDGSYEFAFYEDHQIVGEVLLIDNNGNAYIRYQQENLTLGAPLNFVL